MSATRSGAGGRSAPVGHSATRSSGSAVGLPPGGKANFRLDWDAPYCSDSPGPYALAVELPGTGSISVRLADQTVPGCAQDSTHPELRSFLSPGPVSDGDAHPTRPATSTLSTLTVRASDLPKHIRPGQSVDFTVTLSNPTGKDVSLAGRPGYTLDILCMGTQGHEGLNSQKAYLLNNRPIRRVPAHGSVRFAMQADIPRAASFPGPKLNITWRLITQGLPPNLPYVLVTIPTGA